MIYIYSSKKNSATRSEHLPALRLYSGCVKDLFRLYYGSILRRFAANSN